MFREHRNASSSTTSKTNKVYDGFQGSVQLRKYICLMTLKTIAIIAYEDLVNEAKGVWRCIQLDSK